MSLRLRPRPNGFVAPCLPSPAPKPPVGDGWIHEIKLDGFRLLSRRDAAGVRLLTRRGNDWTARYPSNRHRSRRAGLPSCLIDGEVVICGEDGVPVSTDCATVVSRSLSPRIASGDGAEMVRAREWAA